MLWKSEVKLYYKILFFHTMYVQLKKQNRGYKICFSRAEMLAFAIAG